MQRNLQFSIRFLISMKGSLELKCDRYFGVIYSIFLKILLWVLCISSQSEKRYPHSISKLKATQKMYLTLKKNLSKEKFQLHLN